MSSLIRTVPPKRPNATEPATCKLQPATYNIPSRFHPGYSLLGSWIRERVGDRRRAESLFIVTSGVVALVLALSQYFAWALLDPPEIRFLISQIIVAGLYAVVCLIGRQPEITVTLADRGIEINRRIPSAEFPWILSREVESDVVPFRRIRRVTTIDANLYYRHHARYAGTRAFVNRIPPRLVLIELPDGPVILGLEPADCAAFLRQLEERTAAEPSPRVA